jgi:hypothetical protein
MVTDLNFKSAINIGSKYIEITLNADGQDNLLSVENPDYLSIKFFKDSKGRLVGSFVIHSKVPENDTAMVAFSVSTSSKVPYKITP